VSQSTARGCAGSTSSALTSIVSTHQPLISDQEINAYGIECPTVQTPTPLPLPPLNPIAHKIGRKRLKTMALLPRSFRLSPASSIFFFSFAHAAHPQTSQAEGL